MKKALPIFCLAILLFNTVGYQFIYLVKERMNRQEILDLIKKGQYPKLLSKIVINEESVDELSWENDSEFKYKGRKYDVARTEYKGTERHYYCIDDENETRLSDNFGHLVNQQSRQESNGKNVLKALFSLIFLPAENISIIPVLSGHRQEFLFKDLTSPGFSDAIDLPPRYIS